MIWLVFALLTQDEAPLVQPIIETAARAESVSAVPAKKLFHLGLKASGYVQSGTARLGPLGAIELGVRFPFGGERLGLMLAGTLGGTFSVGGVTTIQGLIVGVPLVVTYHERVGPGHLRLYAGPSLDWTSTTSQSAGRSVQDQFLSVGMTAAFGYLFDAGPGKFILDLGYRLLTQVFDGVSELTHAGLLSVGYAFWL